MNKVYFSDKHIKRKAYIRLSADSSQFTAANGDKSRRKAIFEKYSRQRSRLQADCSRPLKLFPKKTPVHCC